MYPLRVPLATDGSLQRIHLRRTCDSTMVRVKRKGEEKKRKKPETVFPKQPFLSYFIISTECMVGVDSVMLSDWVK